MEIITDSKTENPSVAVGLADDGIKMSGNTADSVTDASASDDGFVDSGFDDRHCQKIIESILFAAGHPMTYEKIASVIGKTPTDTRRIINDFAEMYNRDDLDVARGVLLLTFDDCCQLSTKEQYGTYIREALGIRRGGNLSPSSVEVLAIVAYNQPVTRAFIDTVRGVDSSYLVGTLSDKHLIEVCGRLDVPGRPLLYRTTPDFLRVFGLSSLTELPEVAPVNRVENMKLIPLDESEEMDTDSADSDDEATEADDEVSDETDGTEE